MRLIHYSDHYLTAVHSADPGPAPERIQRKPFGLWVSVEGEDDWPAWCRTEDFRLELLTHPTEVVLRPDANILCIGSAAELRRFQSEYGEDHRVLGGWIARWDDVGAKHDGIIIAPYIWSMRLDHAVSWYYTWDCASGCIWNANAVAELRPLPIAHSTAAPPYPHPEQTAASEQP